MGETTPFAHGGNHATLRVQQSLMGETPKTALLHLLRTAGTSATQWLPKTAMAPQDRAVSPITYEPGLSLSRHERDGVGADFFLGAATGFLLTGADERFLLTAVDERFLLV